jgi:hypothetical protein
VKQGGEADHTQAHAGTVQEVAAGREQVGREHGGDLSGRGAEASNEGRMLGRRDPCVEDGPEARHVPREQGGWIKPQAREDIGSQDPIGARSQLDERVVAIAESVPGVASS